MSKPRDLGYVAWKDDQIWMESMKGDRWRALVKDENLLFQAALKPLVEKRETETLLKEFESAEEVADLNSQWVLRRGGTKLKVIPRPGGSYEFYWIKDGDGGDLHAGKSLLVEDLDIGEDGLVVFSKKIDEKRDMYRISAVKGVGESPLWTFTSRGGSIAALEDRLYILEGDKPIQYTRLVSYDLKTGGGKRIHYKETNASILLSLVRGENQCLFLLGDNAGRQELRLVEGGRIERVSPEYSIFLPLGKERGKERGKEQACYFRKRGFGAPWELVGVKEPWTLPDKLESRGLEGAHLSSGLLIQVEHGERILTFCKGGNSAEALRVFGEVEMHPWHAWFGGDGLGVPLEFHLLEPGCAPRKGLIREEPKGKSSLSLFPSNRSYGEKVNSGFAKSADGTKVRWISCTNYFTEKPKGLLAIVYGSYGISTPLSTARWAPYLESGWAIGFAFVRGGGDHTVEWAEAGRREGKARGLEDYIACIREMRRALRIPAEKVCLFGRSAGGFLVGSAVAHYEKEFGAVYTEVPYVDALNTASNPELPLTAYEYLEFGNPKKSISDLETLLRYSPVTALGPEGAPGLFVLCRVGCSDMQVLAYESAKWIECLRGGRGTTEKEAKYLAFNFEAGHYTLGSERRIEQTEDYLLLNKKWLK